MSIQKNDKKTISCLFEGSLVEDDLKKAEKVYETELLDDIIMELHHNQSALVYRYVDKVDDGQDCHLLWYHDGVFEESRTLKKEEMAILLLAHSNQKFYTYTSFINKQKAKGGIILDNIYLVVLTPYDIAKLQVDLKRNLVEEVEQLKKGHFVNFDLQSFKKTSFTTPTMEVIREDLLKVFPQLHIDDHDVNDLVKSLATSIFDSKTNIWKRGIFSNFFMVVTVDPESTADIIKFQKISLGLEVSNGEKTSKKERLIHRPIGYEYRPNIGSFMLKSSSGVAPEAGNGFITFFPKASEEFLQDQILALIEKTSYKISYQVVGNVVVLHPTHFSKRVGKDAKNVIESMMISLRYADLRKIFPQERDSFDGGCFRNPVLALRVKEAIRVYSNVYGNFSQEVHKNLFPFQDSITIMKALPGLNFNVRYSDYQVSHRTDSLGFGRDLTIVVKYLGYESTVMVHARYPGEPWNLLEDLIMFNTSVKASTGFDMDYVRYIKALIENDICEVDTPNDDLKGVNQCKVVVHIIHVLEGTAVTFE